MSKIRLMVIDDSIFFRTFITQKLGGNPSIEIVGSFGNPIEAMGRISELRPDVIAVDMEMPNMRGNEFLRTVLPKHPNVKAVVISALSGNVFDAMQAGAIDFIGKPSSKQDFNHEQFVQDLIQKIKVAATARAKSPAPASYKPSTQAAVRQPLLKITHATTKSVIAIGASTGGTEAIIEVIKRFPASTPGVVIVQHMPPVFTRMYAERADKICSMIVREAQNGDPNPWHCNREKARKRWSATKVITLLSLIILLLIPCSLLRTPFQPYSWINDLNNNINKGICKNNDKCDIDDKCLN